MFAVTLRKQIAARYSARFSKTNGVQYLAKDHKWHRSFLLSQAVEKALQFR